MREPRDDPGYIPLPAVIAMRSESRGQSLVEFALVLPVFLLFVFVLIDGGRYVYTDSVLSQAAREAARVAAVEASWIGKTTSDDPGCNQANGPVCRSSAALVAADAQAAANRMTIGLGGTITGVSMSVMSLVRSRRRRKSGTPSRRQCHARTPPQEMSHPSG